MKIIDLLNKIANDEEVPKKINYSCYKFEYNEDKKIYESDEIELGAPTHLGDIVDVDKDLNDEIEIIEEDKKIKHINKTYDLTDFVKDYPKVANLIQDIANKQYEIIDYLNERGKQC